MTGLGGAIVVVVVVVVVLETLFADVSTHRNPLEVFLHRYLTFFDVRRVPAFAHFVLEICDAVLDEDNETINSSDAQTPIAKPCRLFIA
jgi:hypothetical protein